MGGEAEVLENPIRSAAAASRAPLTNEEEPAAAYTYKSLHGEIVATKEYYLASGNTFIRWRQPNGVVNAQKYRHGANGRRR